MKLKLLVCWLAIPVSYGLLLCACRYGCSALQFHFTDILRKQNDPSVFYFLIPDRVCYQIAPRKKLFIAISFIVFLFIFLLTFCGETLFEDLIGWEGEVGKWEGRKEINCQLLFLDMHCGNFLAKIVQIYQFYGKLLTPLKLKNKSAKNFRSFSNLCTAEHEFRVNFLKCVFFGGGGVEFSNQFWEIFITYFLYKWLLLFQSILIISIIYSCDHNSQFRFGKYLWSSRYVSGTLEMAIKWLE